MGRRRRCEEERRRARRRRLGRARRREEERRRGRRRRGGQRRCSGRRRRPWLGRHLGLTMRPLALDGATTDTSTIGVCEVGVELAQAALPWRVGKRLALAPARPDQLADVALHRAPRHVVGVHVVLVPVLRVEGFGWQTVLEKAGVVARLRDRASVCCHAVMVSAASDLLLRSAASTCWHKLAHVATWCRLQH